MIFRKHGTSPYGDPNDNPGLAELPANYPAQAAAWEAISQYVSACFSQPRFATSGYSREQIFAILLRSDAKMQALYEKWRVAMGVAKRALPDDDAPAVWSRIKDYARTAWVRGFVDAPNAVQALDQLISKRDEPLRFLEAEYQLAQRAETERTTPVDLAKRVTSTEPTLRQIAEAWLDQAADELQKSDPTLSHTDALARVTKTEKGGITWAWYNSAFAHEPYKAGLAKHQAQGRK